MSHCAKMVFLQNFGDVKSEVFEKKITFFVFVFLCWKNRSRKKEKKWKRPKKPYKNCFFWRWSCKNVKNQKNGFLQKLPDTICVRKGEKTHFRAHYLFWPKIFWPKTVQTRKNYKNSGFSGNCPKPKMTPFLGKRCFLDMGVLSGLRWPKVA